MRPRSDSSPSSLFLPPDTCCPSPNALSNSHLLFLKQLERWTREGKPYLEEYVGKGLLKGKAAIITGGDSGIGRTVAIFFAREGADITINYLPEEEKE